VFAVLTGVGTKLIYDYYQKKSDNVAGVVNSPIYKGTGLSGTNVFYEPKGVTP